MSNIPVYAHRGAPSGSVENSLKAFKRAVKIGADGIELDLQLSADGVAFVTHDIDFFRLAGKNRRITDMTAEEILQLKLGKAFNRKFFYSRVLTFDDFLQFAVPIGIKLNIELKESFLGKIEKIIEVVEKTKGIPDVHFSSFEFSILQTIHAMGLKAKTAFIGKKNSDWDYVLSIKEFEAIHLNKRFYNSELMYKIWGAGFPIRYYNVKGNEKFITNPHESVIGWITDYPEKIIQRQKRNLT
ncbi:glycerophosphodiester phosphodiesterase family protein [Bacillus sp. FJAT-22090]|uniref:glycerophosphodiester phosphodiesterase n=1 Tax=Bacillus sp. FJAT-22090 TaxID=1581038 RepID=UPI0011A6E349|nr:glycerophosphodiester phosphodiesterase family protein [Bacillus sp. FJAT-22090]